MEKCNECNGDGYRFEAGKPGHRRFKEECLKCKGKGTVSNIVLFKKRISEATKKAIERAENRNW